MKLVGTKTVHVSEVTASPTSDQREEVGAVAFTYDATNGLRQWKYVQFDNGAGDVASADGSVAYYVAASYTSSVVTCDVSDTDQNHVAGVFTQAFTDQYYGWLQVGGYHGTVKTNGDDDIAAGVSLFGVGDGTCDSMTADTASTNTILGYALAADVDGSNTVAARITVGAI